MKSTDKAIPKLTINMMNTSQVQRDSEELNRIKSQQLLSHKELIGFGTPNPELEEGALKLPQIPCIERSSIISNSITTRPVPTNRSKSGIIHMAFYPFSDRTHKITLKLKSPMNGDHKNSSNCITPTGMKGYQDFLKDKEKDQYALYLKNKEEKVSSPQKKKKRVPPSSKFSKF